jgi:hypothetical protein
MKKVIIGLLMVLAAGVCWGQRMIVVVAPLEPKGGMTQDDADAIREMFVDSVSSTQAVQVVERDIHDIEREYRFQMSDWSDDAKSARLGAVLNADCVITWNVTAFRNQFRVTGKILDVATNTVLGTAQTGQIPLDDLPDHIDKLAASMLQAMMSKSSIPIVFYGDTLQANERRALTQAVQQGLQKNPVSANGNTGLNITFVTQETPNSIICDVSMALTRNGVVVYQSKSKRINFNSRDVIITEAARFLQDNAEFYQAASRY